MFHTIGMKTAIRIREPVVEGIFYPVDPTELDQLVDNYIKETPQGTGDALGVVSPHAGYEFCGSCIGASFSAARDRPIETIVLIAPVHREPADEIFLTESDGFRTPLGIARVATHITNEMESCSTRIIRNDIPHFEEHAIEVQLPFAQHLFPKARIVPILLGRASLSNVRALAGAIEAVIGSDYQSTLFVISSNLCSNCEPGRAESETTLLQELIEKGDAEVLLDRFHRGDITACGAGCIASLLMLSIPGIRVDFHTQCDSGLDRLDAATFYGALTLHARNK